MPPPPSIRPAAQLLLMEAEALPPVLEAAPVASFDAPTVCDGWSVRDVLAHCAAALTRVASGDLHAFTPEDNERDVEARRRWPLDRVIAELVAGYEAGARGIDTAGGALDGVGLGEWIHGGDVRDALGVGGAYTSPGGELAVELLIERSVLVGAPSLACRIDGRERRFGPAGATDGRLDTDLETFVRLCAGRTPDSRRYELTGAGAIELVLFA